MSDLLLCFQKIIADLRLTYKVGFPDRLRASGRPVCSLSVVYSQPYDVTDPLGRRIAKKINGTVVEKYLWKGRTTLLAVHDGNDNLRRFFQYADGRLPLAMTKDGANYYLCYDQVGSLRIVIDTSGNVVKALDYDSYGNVLSDSDSTFAVPFAFAGGFPDSDSDIPA